ncbi:hypothetical protein EON67_05045 [archaeon]|nr:MAG: hypothetical protein EON67_05045 [archaeon]
MACGQRERRSAGDCALSAAVSAVRTTPRARNACTPALLREVGGVFAPFAPAAQVRSDRVVPPHMTTCTRTSRTNKAYTGHTAVPPYTTSPRVLRARAETG